MGARLIVFDLETYRTREAATVERIKREAREKEPAKTASKDTKFEWYTDAAKEARSAEALDKTAVNVLAAEILVACYSVDIEAPVAIEGYRDEAQAMRQLAQVLNAVTDDKTVWAGHNICGFDLPLLLNRWRRHGIRPPSGFPVFDDGRWRGRVWDTMRRTPGPTPYISMEAACAICGVELRETPWKGAPMWGARVGEAYESGDWGVITTYCLEDVRATRALYMAQTANDTWGTWGTDNGAGADVAEIECDPSLTEAQKAMAQKNVLKAAGLWPRA